MNLIVELVSINKGGAEQVAVSFLNECRAREGHNYHVFLRDNIKRQIDVEAFADNFTFYDFDERPGQGFFSFVRVTGSFKRLVKEIDPDCVVSTGGHSYWNPDVPFVCGFNIPHYLYPDSPYFDEATLKVKSFWFIKKYIDFYFYRRAATLFVQTDVVRKRLAPLVGDTPVKIIPNAVNGHFLTERTGRKKLPDRTEGEYRCLLLCAAYTHKNIKIIRPVIDRLKKYPGMNIRFVLTLPHDYCEQFFGPEYDNCIYNIGSVPISECPDLYAECDCMFLPTFLECFSASYLEAMAMEVPIITSDYDFARCVCGDAAAYFDSTDPDDVTEKLVELASDPQRQADLVAKGRIRFQMFNGPDQRVADILSICEKLVQRKCA